MVIQSLEKKFIAIDGPIGVGKSTLAKHLAEYLGSPLLQESIEDNPFLPMFYENNQSALAAQLSFLFSRRKQWKNIQQANLFEQSGLVSDYLFAKDRLFATLNLSDDELALYDHVARLTTSDIHRPDLVIYLQASPEALLARVRKRGRSFEHSLSMDYLKKVSDAYRQFFFHYSETPLLVVQTDHLNFASNEENFLSLIKRVQQMRSGKEFWADYS